MRATGRQGDKGDEGDRGDKGDKETFSRYFEIRYMITCLTASDSPPPGANQMDISH